MKNTQLKMALTTAIGTVLTLSAVTSVSATELRPAASQPTEIKNAISVNTDGMYIVLLESPSVALYEGGISGYKATNPRANGKKRLDTNSKEAKKYAKFLREQQKEVLGNAGQKFGRDLETSYDYQHAINGFAVQLTAQEAKAMASMDGVLSVQPETIERLNTDAGPQWIGAPGVWTNPPNSTKGEGVVVAILDSGINHDHPSFADVGDDGYDHTNPLGSDNYIPGSYCDTVDPSFCNDKLIGAWDFLPSDGYGSVPEDDDGHGSHTASTAAGNVVNNAVLEAPTTTAAFDISGVAPHANIIAYDVCSQTCPGAGLLAAINQVVIDAGTLPNGIAAMNYSISGGADPYNNPLELGFKSMVEVGVYVSASAGNSGPTPSTVAHLGPWTSTTAASTHNRAVVNAVIDVNSEASSTPDIAGLGFTSGYGPAPIINSADLEADFPGSTLCGLGSIGDFIPPWPAGTFNGEIVACTRGTFGRVEKGANVLAAGAGGYILMDNGGGVVGDAHVLPGVHISQTDAAVLGPWITAENLAGNNPMASIEGYSIDLGEYNGDIMAGFSSRGPQLEMDVLKPDLTAPGVSIFAAEADGQAASSPEYQFLGGTSMSSPHNAGAGALMTARHPDWTPQEIKSALMLTARTSLVKEDGVTPADPFDFGAGHIQVDQAQNSGLVMSESIANFDAANPDLGGDPSSLNLASMMNSNCVVSCSWTRTVTNAMNNTGHWNVTAEADGFDVEVTVSPQSKSDDYNLKLKKGQSATITVTATTVASDVGWHFGQVHFDRNVEEAPDLQMPIAVFASVATNPDVFTKVVDSDTAAPGDILSYQIDVTNGPLAGPITVTDVVPEGTTFVLGSETESVVSGSTTVPWAYDGGSNTLTWEGELDTNSIGLAPGGSPFGYLPLSGFFAPLPLTCNGDCDDGGYAFTFGLPFTYNGATTNQVILSVNGTVEVGQASGVFTSFANQNLPDPTAPNNILAPFWRDLNLNAGGNMYAGTLGFGFPAPTWHIFEWENVPHFGSADAVTMQVWIGVDGTPVAGEISYVYARMDNTGVGGTVGAENAAGTVGESYFYNGAGTAPAVGVDLVVVPGAGGSATLGFQVEADCSADPIVNQADLSNAGDGETAIAVTSCP